MTTQGLLSTPDESEPINHISVDVRGTQWRLHREANLEALWEAIGEGDFGADERLPYWTELWPSSHLLADWLHDQADRLPGARCLDVGCGLGLSALVAASLGATVAAFDYEIEALGFARRSAVSHKALITKAPLPLFFAMDWRNPSIKEGSFDFIWGGDIAYERRFEEPLAALFSTSLAKGGEIWLAEPNRSVAAPLQKRLLDAGFKLDIPRREPVPVDKYTVDVSIWRLYRP